MTALLSVTLTGSIASAVLILFKKRFLKNLSCKWYYYVCVCAMLLFVVPIRFPVWRIPPASSVVPSFIYEVQKQQIQIASPSPPAMTKRHPGVTVVPDQAPSSVLITPERILTAFWISGAVIILIRYLQSYFKVKNKVGKTTPVMFYKGLAVHQSSYINSPILIGFIHPKIIMPDRDDGGLEYQLALEHEYTHYRHRDSWCKLFAVLVSAVHWFNPIVHLALKNINECCEYACDETVTSNMSMEEKKQYSETILKYICSASPALSSALSKNKQHILRRFEVIMNTNKKSRRLLGTLALVTILIFSVLVTSIVFAEENPPLTELNGGISTYYAINRTLEENVQHAFGTPFGSESGMKMIVKRFVPYYTDEYGIEIRSHNKNEVAYGVRLGWQENNEENSHLIQKTADIQGKQVKVGFTEQALLYKDDKIIDRMIQTQIAFELSLGHNSISGDYDHTAFINELIERGIYVIDQVIEPQGIELNLSYSTDGAYAFGNKILTRYDKKEKIQSIFGQKIKIPVNMDGNQGLQLGDSFALQAGETLAIDIKEASGEIDRINWAIVDVDTGDTIFWIPNAAVRDRWVFIPLEELTGKRVSLRVSAQGTGECELEVFTYATDETVYRDMPLSKIEIDGNDGSFVKKLFPYPTDEPLSR